MEKVLLKFLGIPKQLAVFFSVGKLAHSNILWIMCNQVKQQLDEVEGYGFLLNGKNLNQNL